MGGLRKDRNRRSCRPRADSDRRGWQVTRGRTGVGSRTASWGGGRTGACMQAEGEMGHRLSPSLPEAGLPPPPPRWAEAHNATRDPSLHVPSPGRQPRLSGQRAPEHPGQSLPQGPGDGSAHAGLGQGGPCPRPGSTLLFAPQPRRYLSRTALSRHSLRAQRCQGTGRPWARGSFL